MNLYFGNSARIELEEAVAHYDECRFGLGEEFREEVERITERIAADPTSLPPHDLDTRICCTRRFPYGVVYQVFDDHIQVVAVAHLHRQPGYWRNRLNE